MTVLSELPAAVGDKLFGPPGTTIPGASWPPAKQFLCSLLMAGAAATGTLTVVTPADAAAMRAAVIESRTLPAMPSSPPVVDRSMAVPSLLQRLRRVSGLSWGDVAAALGVSRRTIHNWLSGTRVAGVHLTRLIEFERVVNATAAGSADDTRSRLVRPGPHGRSLLDELALSSRADRRRPISTLSVGDIVGPVDQSPDRCHR
jgi:transcriptional regulator with XRE-family HTH domain